MKKHTWIATTLTTCAMTALVHAQPTDAPPPDPGTSPPAAQPVQPARPIAHVGAITPAHVEPRDTSATAFVATPADILYPSAPQGDWTLVENDEGDTGWVKTTSFATSSPPPSVPADPYAEVKPPPKPRPPRPKDPHIDMPEVLTTPTGWLLPAAVLYSRTSLDTGGGVSSDNRVGLGDVAEFGIATTDNVRIKDTATAEPSQIQPYVTASFRMGVAEDRLFENQPGIVLGFVKSFERTSDSVKTRIAELTLVASKKFGSRFAMHAGGAFWDAEISGSYSDGTPLDETLHGYNDASRQIRPFGGLEARPFDRSEILVDLGWAPVFCKDCAAGSAIQLRPELSWGVRYEVTDFMRLESGVRVPDIGDFNLLNAQIFGQVTFTTWGLRHAVDDLK